MISARLFARPRRAVILAATAVAVAVPTVIVADARPALAAPTEYVTMTDGVQIAVNVRMPDNYVPGQRYPTIFEMSGYDGGSAAGGTLAADAGVPDGTPLPTRDSRQLTELFYDEYVTVHASVRGTGCSSGEFDLFSWRSALDGKEIIDNWIPAQPWSNAEVGIIGHSYGGITGFMIAATRPQHLRAASVSGLIDDLYRGIVYPGGVSNYGFPLLWTGGIRAAYDVAGGLLPGIVRPVQESDADRAAACAENVVRKSRTVVDDPIVQGLFDTDNDWYRSRSLITYARDIAVPIHITGAYQDEQTGPRGQAHLYEKVQGVPKRLVLTNGTHDTQSTADYGVPEIRADRRGWMDHFLRGVEGGFGHQRTSVTVFLETHDDGSGTLAPNGRLDSTSFPLPETTWTDWYLHADGTFSPGAPALPEGSASYVSGTKRQSWSYQAGPAFGPPFTTADGPDELNYHSAPMPTDTAVVGPVAATLFVQASAPDTELFVDVIDEAPDGSRSYLQRGLLRASHRAVDPAQSDRTPDGRIYRPWRPHTNPTLVVPGATTEYLVEVWPIGHVFRTGHRILIKVHAPPSVDSYYAYAPRSAPGVNTVLHGSLAPSRVMLPLVPLRGVHLGPPLACGAQEGVRCVPPGDALY